MTKLEYKLTRDTLFKVLFVNYPHLLKRLVAQLLGIPLESIEEFVIVNPEIPPDAVTGKFCRLDIHMTVNGQRVDLEVQVEEEKNYPDRTLFYWARAYSSGLNKGEDYAKLLRTVSISITDFVLFDDSDDFHSEFQPLEVTRGTRLTDKMSLHYFELPKLPEVVNADDELKLWLMLFKAETEEDLIRIEKMEVPIMAEAISAYRHVSVSNEFKELERLRSKARHDEASALANAERRERQKWLSIVEQKDAALADKDAALADKDAALADKEAENERLRAEIERLCGENG